MNLFDKMTPEEKRVAFMPEEMREAIETMHELIHTLAKDGWSGTVRINLTYGSFTIEVP